MRRLLLNYMFNRFGNIVKNLTVFPENMKRNMERTLRVDLFPTCSLALIDKGLSREEAYDTVQPKAWKHGKSKFFRDILERDPRVMELLSKRK